MGANDFSRNEITSLAQISPPLCSHFAMIFISSGGEVDRFCFLPGVLIYRRFEIAFGERTGESSRFE